MRFTTSKGLLASLAVAGAMVGGLLLTPANAQDAGKGDAKPANITISGTALLPDGSPAAKLPVAIKSIEKHMIGAPGEGGGGDPGAPPPDLLSQEGAGGAKGKGGKAAKGAKGGVYKTIGRGMTDDSGRFSVKATTFGQGDQTVMVEVGEITKTPFLRKTVATHGKDVDMGNLTLNPVGGSGGTGG